MRILEVAEGAKRTGSAAAALASARALAGRGHEITWLTEAGSALAAAGRDAGLNVEDRLNLSILGLRRAGRLIRELAAKHDLVHVHRSKSHLAALLGLGFSGRARPLVRTCHAGRPGETRVWARWLVGKAEALVIRSAALAFDLRASAAAGGARLGVIPGGVDETVFHTDLDGSAVREKLGLADRLTVGIVARLKPGRRLLQFCQAAEKLSRDKAFDNVNFLVIGRGELNRALSHWVEKAGLFARVKFHDPGEAFPQALAALDVGVLLMPGSDGSARTALELAALGKPLVLGNVGALADLAGPQGECARLTSPDSVEEIAGAIGELAADSEQRARLGAAARARFEERHTLARLGENYEKLLASLVERAS